MGLGADQADASNLHGSPQCEGGTERERLFLLLYEKVQRHGYLHKRVTSPP